MYMFVSIYLYLPYSYTCIFLPPGEMCLKVNVVDMEIHVE